MLEWPLFFAMARETSNSHHEFCRGLWPGQQFRSGFAERAVAECSEILLANSQRSTSREPLGMRDGFVSKTPPQFFEVPRKPTRGTPYLKTHSDLNTGRYVSLPVAFGFGPCGESRAWTCLFDQSTQSECQQVVMITNLLPDASAPQG